MENKLSSPLVLDGSVCNIKFSISTTEEIMTYSINECPISHPSQLANPFLGLPLESGRCESCGTAEIGNCEGHFGHIELPVPIYHPSHVSELRDILSMICLKCLRVKKVRQGEVKGKISSISCFYCRDLPPISVKEGKTSDGAIFLQLTVSSRTKMRESFWNFLDRFGYHYGATFCRPLLPYEALNILKQIPEETKKALSGKGYSPQRGFIMQHLPVPPNCLCVPEINDGKCVMSSDISKSLLKKVLNKIELIKRSRSGSPNFESHEVESNDLQLSITQYIHLRGTTKAPHDIKSRFVQGSESSELPSKQWLEKIRTLFISKGSGFSSRCVITGDPYIGVDVIGLPSEIAKRITFEERVTEYNINHLQNIVDKRLCITYKDGSSTYAISLGSKGHTSLKVGQIINRQIIDGDIVFINRPPSTHKHSLQAFHVYVHEDHTVKINPLICAPLGADFDGDCIHIFYPQSLSAKAEVAELFSVEKQLLSSHSGNMNLQLVHDSLLALKLISNLSFIGKAVAQQLSMFESPVLPSPAVIKANNHGPCWTFLQILQNVLPSHLNSCGDNYTIYQSEFLKFDSSRDIVQSLLTDIPTSIYRSKGPKDVLNFFNYIQPLLMEVLFMEGFSVSLKDFYFQTAIIEEIRRSIQKNCFILGQLRSGYNELVHLQFEKYLKSLKSPIADFLFKFSALGSLIDAKNDSAIVKVVEQIGFLGLQLFDQGKYYSKALVDDCFTTFMNKHFFSELDCPSEAYGLVKSSFFHGLAPFEGLVHAISTREIIVRSSRGLTEPGTLFKNLMAILRDVIICYDGTIRNVCTGSIVQIKYLDDEVVDSLTTASPGEPVGVLAATAISNPAYKAVLDSSQSNNSSWELMKEILLCKTGYKNDVSDRRVILYLNDCYCRKRFCKEKAVYAVFNCLKKVCLKDWAREFYIEYRKQIDLPNKSETFSGLVGHVHLDKTQLKLFNQNIDEILGKCQDVLFKYTKKKGQLSQFIKRVVLSVCECCNYKQPHDGDLCHFPCLQFTFVDANTAQNDESLECAIHVMAKVICPILLDTIVKGDPRVFEAKIVWIEPDATSWAANSCKTLKGELGLEIVLEKAAVRENGDAWRMLMDACLPVMHLIDTSRSCPYGIQQNRELLGISCAFDQAVKRLSRSIRMVSKGVMKEHLLLVANSITCTGNLVGFNTGGYKALFRSFKVQVPFTAATLFTPMKCFETAAEKCQTDSLTSVVSSCSWGKKVAIGTGAPFQILWDKNQTAMHKDIGKGVYDFLEMLNPTLSGEATGACLADVDDIIEDQEMEVCLSPVANGHMTFEENHEVEYSFKKNLNQENRKIENSCRDFASDFGDKSGNWQGWESRQDSGKMAETNAWSSWDSQHMGQITVGSWENKDSQNCSDPSVELNAWGKGTEKNVASWETRSVKSSGGDIWNEKVTKNLEEKEGTSVWKNISWRPKGNSNEDAFSLPGTLDSESSKEPWVVGARDNTGNSWKNGPDAAKLPKATTWGSSETEFDKDLNSVQNGKSYNGRDKSWNSNATVDFNNQQSGNSTRNLENPWTCKPTDDSNNQWNNNPWSSNATRDCNNHQSSNLTKEMEKPWTDNNQSNNNSTWDSIANQDFEKQQSGDLTRDMENPWICKPIEDSNSQRNDNGSSTLNNFDSGNQTWNSGGWGSATAAGRRNQKKYGGKPPGTPDSRKVWNPNRPSISRRPLESLSTEEEKVLAEVEPIMQIIKRILRDSSDGDRLSDDDQKFILENVFSYHPDKQSKVADQLDYIMVDKHGTYQDSRCFFAVSRDGTKADFSYIKCMGNFVKRTFSEHGESFCQKYFKRRRVEPAEDNSQQLP
ncbi:DNA-directed RNA polymerase V subunit 1-like [Zingiber officinale]|uniref:DNA-directed RNA polymerase V subunit 1-like n=1 Tax=Zingiber officinale TaxID=94328 RepID=UPI001C4B48EF|nr:DNA-directed RNA polymerase V subunit 1-like [Zingiber officinale]XP_042474125.1 DNA-directed RNA polymerase V subunit 1-like [Zingiber officinale]XP_042474127.1 DNA-directed RNA polymerase V subunit 1-like [Zingiber officinale]XP_042474128.1 DNA-directed RNA polymerase V subunit 1-like [Zingiber officinale]XP_042474129.1 DNA-directed RNA polymerase V subunit 1-like [Zingiber officinale]